jgi:hypothetical protein
MPKARDGVASPGGVGDVTSERKAEPGGSIWRTESAVLYAHGSELFEYCFFTGENPREDRRNSMLFLPS